MLVEIKNDVFDVVKRIKKIDRNYRVVYNTKKAAYELHNKAQIFTSYCLTFPYKFIDARMVDYTLKTQSKNREKILKEIEQENEKMLKNKIKESKEKLLKGDENDNKKSA